MQTQDSWISSVVDSKSAFFHKPMSLEKKHRSVLEKLWWGISDAWKNYWPTEPDKKENFLRQMYYLAYVDQYLSEKERSFILDTGLRIQLQKDRIIELGHQSANQVPRTLRLPRKNRFFYIFSLINLIRMGGEVSEDAVCRAQSLLMKQGYAPDTVDIILSTIESNKKKGISSHQTYKYLREMLA